MRLKVDTKYEMEPLFSNRIERMLLRKECEIRSKNRTNRLSDKCFLNIAPNPVPYFHALDKLTFLVHDSSCHTRKVGL